MGVKLNSGQHQHINMNEIEFLNKHWFMYHKLEDEFMEIEKTIPIDEENFNTFSYSYMKLLGLICCEFNECFKNFAKHCNSNCNSINKYKKFINDNFPNFINCEVNFGELGYERLSFKPFENWSDDKGPFWWEVNNGIKHNRNIDEIQEGKENYKLANQKCILYALSGLFSLNVYFYTIITHGTSYVTLIMPQPSSKIF